MIKIELGCGRTKQEGYIGVDRFDMPGVDVVADLNSKFPFDDDSIDEIWACHSLEHLEDLSHVFSEIYRIIKNKGIVRILAPYYFTTLNISNFYHKNVWTEDTPRMFDIYATDMVDSLEWQMPHALNWGVGRSDNSDFKDVFQIAKEEFFYFPEYCHLSDDLKRQARRSMINVCDQVYYILVVNKTNESFTRDEIEGILQEALKCEPEIIKINRKRDSENAQKQLFSIFDRMSYMEKLSESGAKAIEKLNSRILEDKNDILDIVKSTQKECNKLIQINEKEFNKQIQIKEKEYNKQIQIKEKELTKRMAMMGSSTEDVGFAIKNENRSFYDGLLLNDNYKRIGKIYLSSRIGERDYKEYLIDGAFSELSIFVVSLSEASVLFELVQEGKIVGQMVEVVDGLQKVNICNNSVSSRSYIRIRLLEEKIDSMVKVLLVEDLNREKIAYIRKN